jgi:hypothetical protein
MDHDNRKTIDELITRYILEPELRDLYVEGPGEKTSYSWFFRKFECKSVAIFEIDSVDIPDSLLANYKLQSGNRDELIALAIEFQRLLKDDLRFLLCVVDSDFDFLLGRTYCSRYLLYSEYTSTDLCFCSEETFEKFFMLGLRFIPCNISILLANFAKILQEIFLIRTANEKLGWCLEWIDFNRYCSIKDNLVVFNSNKFIESYLSKNNRLKDLEQFISVYDQLRRIKVKTFKHRIRGHDFFELLSWYVSKQVGHRGRKYRDSEVVRTAIVSAVRPESLISTEPFKTLLNTYKS